MWQTGGHHRILLNHFTYVEHKVFKDKAVEINAYRDAFVLPCARKCSTLPNAATLHRQPSATYLILYLHCYSL